MKKKILIMSFILILLIIFIYKMYPKSGTLDTLVLTKYTNTDFVYINISKENVHKEYVYKTYDDINKINDFLSYLKKIKLTEYNGSISYDANTYYNIGIYTNSDTSFLGITIASSNFIEITMKTYAGKHISKKYKINDNSLDMKYIESFYNSGKSIQ